MPPVWRLGGGCAFPFYSWLWFYKLALNGCGDPFRCRESAVPPSLFRCDDPIFVCGSSRSDGASDAELPGAVGHRLLLEQEGLREGAVLCGGRDVVDVQVVLCFCFYTLRVHRQQ